MNFSETAPLQDADLVLGHDDQPTVSLCLRCGARMTTGPQGGQPPSTCSEACKKAVWRKRRTLAPFIRIVAMVLEGAPAPDGLPPYWMLVRLMLRAERRKVRAQLLASRLPK